MWGVQLIKDVQQIAFVTQLAPVLEVLEKRQEAQRQQIERVNRNVEEGGEHMSDRHHCRARQNDGIIVLIGSSTNRFKKFPSLLYTDDHAAALFTVTGDIGKRRVRIVGVVQYANRIHDIELAVEIHMAAISSSISSTLLRFFVFLELESAFRSTPVTFLAYGETKINMLATAAAAIQYFLVLKSVECIGGDPLGKQPLIVVVDVVPLPTHSDCFVAWA